MKKNREKQKFTSNYGFQHLKQNFLSTNILTLFLLFLGFCLFPIGDWLVERFPFMYFIDQLLFGLMLFVWGITGIIFIARREVPLFFVVLEGRLAVFIGLLVVIICWGFSLVILNQVLAT